MRVALVRVAVAAVTAMGFCLGGAFAVRADNRPAPKGPDEDGTKPALVKIAGEGMMDSHAFQYLTELSDDVGARVTGTPSERKAEDWGAGKMKAIGLENVHKEKYQLWRGWTRGTAQGELLEPIRRPLHVDAMGWTGSTPAVGAEGEVVAANLFDIEEIRGHHFAFRAYCRRRSRPAHCIHVQRPANWFQQFPLRRAARPPAPKLIFFLVHVFEANRFHLPRAPLFGLSFGRRSRHARANVVTQLREILERVRIHHPFARNLYERRLCPVLIRPLRCRSVVRPRRPRPTQTESRSHGRHQRSSCQHESHANSPHVLHVDRLYHALRRTRRLSVSSSPSAFSFLDFLLCAL